MADPRKRVLVVEDDEGVRPFIVEVLSREYDVKAAANGTEARNIVYQEGYDPHILFTDYNFPQGSGIDLAREYLESDKTPSLKGIVVASGGADTEVASQRMPELNGNTRGIVCKFLPKPLTPKIIHAVVQSLENRLQNPQ